jgi:molybdopterin/thiamine biosynthesis adenylyltransferase
MNDQTLGELLRERVRIRERPDGSTYPALLLADAIALATKTALALGEVERFALTAGVVPERYSRNQKALSCAEQLLLLQARVAIIGLGGLGGAVVEMLSRLGIGHLTLVDGDVFDESNLNRQLLSSPRLLGRRKAEVAAARVAEINAAVTTRVIAHFLGADNGGDILQDVDLAIDCLDNIPSRFVLETACRQAAIPLVSAAIAGWSGQATVIFPGDTGLRRLYGPAEDAPRKGIEAALGTLPFAAAHLATVQCAEAATILLGRTSPLRHALLLSDLSDHQSEVVALDNPPELS